MKRLPVNASEAHIIECPSCFEQMVIRDSIVSGDKCKCTNCRKPLMIESIVGHYREDKAPCEVEAVSRRQHN